MDNFHSIDFSDVRLYGITSHVDDTLLFYEHVEALLANGVDALQLRAPGLTDRVYFKIGKKCKELCEKHNALFLVNNRPDMAVLLNADGVHLGHEDLTISQARKIIGHRRLIGASTHALPQALQAQRDGADYVSCGPIWATPTKPTYEPVGLGLISLYKAAIRIPFVTIGSVDKSNIDQVLESGAERIAIVRGLFETKKPAETAKFFKEKINRFLNLENKKSVSVGS